MANEISTKGTLRLFRDSDPKHDITKTFNISLDQTGNSYSAGSQNIGTSEENLSKGDIGTIGAFLIINRDPTNFVELGTTTGQLPIKVPAGKACGPVLIEASNVIAKADTAAVEVEFVLVEL